MSDIGMNENRMNTQTILRARDVRKTFYRPNLVPILKGIDLEVMKGDSVAIMGRSGEGKSTLLQILGTLESACSGDLTIAGQKVGLWNKSAIRNRHLAFIFQSFHLLEDYTALENVLMPAKIARKNTQPKSPAFLRACLLLDKVGLGARKDFNTKLLSGGEKQRVAIARALCNDPDIIFADEPSGNLDKETSSFIHQLLLDFAHQGKTLILVTHDAALSQMCSRRFRLCDGLLVPEHA